jgi:hypothetical protein
MELPHEYLNPDWKPSKAIPHDADEKRPQQKSVLHLTINSNVAFHKLNPVERQKLWGSMNGLMEHVKAEALAGNISRSYGVDITPINSFVFNSEIAPTTGLVHAHALVRFGGPGQLDMTKINEIVKRVFKYGAVNVRSIQDSVGNVEQYVMKGRSKPTHVNQPKPRRSIPQGKLNLT